MKTVTLMILIVFFTFTQASDNLTIAQTETRRPAVSIDEALEIGKKYVRKHQINVSEKYIDSVQLNLNLQSKRGRHWRITYELNKSAKGGQTILFIYMDKSVEVGYGE